MKQVFTVIFYLTSYSSLTWKKQFRNDFPISPVPLNILSDELFLWHSKCAGLWLFQCKIDSFQSSFQQLKSKHTFLATAKKSSLSNSTWHLLLHNLQESVLGWFSNYCVAHKSTVSCLVNCLHDTSSVQDRKCSRQASVSYDNLDNICHTLVCFQDNW
jgi:hypothetical protein